jgi:hypothetical protein
MLGAEEAKSLDPLMILGFMFKLPSTTGWL